MGILTSVIKNYVRKMKLFLLAGAVSAGSQWRASCDYVDDAWVQVQNCGQQFTGFQPVNNTCTYAGGSDSANHRFLGGGAFILDDNTFFGVDGITSPDGDLVVFGDAAAGSCNEQWHNNSDAGYLDNCDFGAEPACSLGAPPSGYYFMGTINDHRGAKDASYNIQFWGENQSKDFAIYDYINETAGKVPTDSEPLSYSLDHQQYNNRIFTATFSNHNGGDLSIANASCGSPGCSVSVDGNKVTLTTGDVNSQLCGFSIYVNGEEIPDLWSSSLVGASIV